MGRGRISDYFCLSVSALKIICGSGPVSSETSVPVVLSHRGFSFHWVTLTLGCGPPPSPPCAVSMLVAYLGTNFWVVSLSSGFLPLLLPV